MKNYVLIVFCVFLKSLLFAQNNQGLKLIRYSERNKPNFYSEVELLETDSSLYSICFVQELNSKVISKKCSRIIEADSIVIGFRKDRIDDGIYKLKFTLNEGKISEVYTMSYGGKYIITKKIKMNHLVKILYWINFYSGIMDMKIKEEGIGNLTISSFTMHCSIYYNSMAPKMYATTENKATEKIEKIILEK